jgi:hypothetical protein
MSTGRFLIATVAGGVTLFIAGFLLWGLALFSWSEGHFIAPAGTQKETAEMLYLGIGQLLWGAFLTVAIGSWAKVAGFGAGFRIGAIAGFLMNLSVGLSQYSMVNMFDLTAVLVDPFVSLIWSGMGGGVVGLVLAKTGRAVEAA